MSSQSLGQQCLGCKDFSSASFKRRRKRTRGKWNNIF